MPKRQQRCERWAFAILLLLVSVQGLQPPAKPRISRGSFLVGAASVFVGAVLPSWADEIGMENDAPTLITGETVEVGPADVLGGLGGSLLADEQRSFHVASTISYLTGVYFSFHDSFLDLYETWSFGGLLTNGTAQRAERQ